MVYESNQFIKWSYFKDNLFDDWVVTDRDKNFILHSKQEAIELCELLNGRR